MTIRIVEEVVSVLPDYARIPIAFTVNSRFRVEPIAEGLGGLALIEETVVPYVKDYDAIPGEGPLHWRERWDTTHWGILSAFEASVRVGGAAIAWKTVGLTDQEMRDDVPVLWDLRVHPDRRGQGIGCQLFARALEWSRFRQCSQLKVETQNINVPACRFYARQGCTLGAINRYAYGPELDEAQMLWYRSL